MKPIASGWIIDYLSEGHPARYSDKLSPSHISFLLEAHSEGALHPNLYGGMYVGSYFKISSCNHTPTMLNVKG